MDISEHETRRTNSPHADAAFRIGASHKICQDYAISSDGDCPYVILADGCSSSPTTDVGARLLVHSAEREIGTWALHQGAEEPGTCPEELLHKTIDSAGRHAASLGLDPSCLDATLLTLRVIGRQWNAMIAGDGVLVRKDRDGRQHITSISFTENYPCYLNYYLDPGRRDAFAQRPGNRRVVESWTVSPRGDVEVLLAETGPADAPPYRASGCIQASEWIVVLSDGVRSMVASENPDKNGAQRDVPMEVTLKEMLSFRAANGVFVQRRMQKFVQECVRRNWRFHDDLSLGAIAFELAD